MPDEELSELKLEELSFVYAATEAAKKDERFKEIHFPIRQQIIYWAAIEALKKAEALYIAYSKVPSYPYIDPSGAAWVFSAEDLASKLADDLKAKQHLDLLVRKIENKMILPMIAQLYYLGIDKVIVDNGSHPLLLKRTDILPEPDWNKEGQAGQNFYNGPLQFSMVQFFQYIQFNGAMQKAASDENTSEEEKQALKQKLEQAQKVVKLMESRMLSHLVDAKFLVPTVTMKDGKPLPPGQNVPAGESVTRKIANLVDGNKVTWLPAFTDWPEFAKTYKPTEWGAVVLPYESVVRMAKDTKIGRIVFNARGCSFRMDEKMIENIEGFRQRKAEFEAKKAAEQGEDQAKEQAASAKQQEPVRGTEQKQPVSDASAEQRQDAPSIRQAAAEQNKKAADQDEKPVYGELVDTPELLVGAMKRTAKALRHVKRMWLAQRIQGDKTGYLLVIESSSDAAGAVEELKRATAGYLDGKEMEIRQADPSSMQLVENIKPFYKKGLFG